MAPLKIVLEGKSSITRQPERAALVFVVQTSGPSRETVSQEVTGTSNEINRLFKELSPKAETGETIAGSPVTSFSSTSLQTRSQVPRDMSGEPLPTVYTATISLNVLFQDFKKLNEIVGKLISYPNIEIKSLDWCLTEATQKSLNSESREEAMRDAVRKANDYARVIAREVIAVEITELGGGGQFEMRAGQYNSYMHMQPMQQMQQQQMAQAGIRYSSLVDSPALNSNAHLGASSGLDLSPQLIRYKNSVQVEFQGIDI
ncbi:uncharacterized protein N7500_006836 [Penicillium coprophilum]|uniref:uncharacterized protein n=1 Tax=Penicillium coprophilum TaxID=36646 RepID=UPI0023A19923|nr:uncharacterized protein N7500_006836 [Penicillium coprophilum]KAJ5165006.1 hypothetical protein N7500_006836 [Penicillium coprophilum]